MEKMTITYKKPHLETEIKREIFILDNFQQNLFLFKERFEQTVKRAGWKKKEAVQMLQEVVSDDILKLIESSNSVEEAFQILLVAKYDKTQVQKTNNYLNKLKLYNYQTIEELLATIDGCL